MVSRTVLFGIVLGLALIGGGLVAPTVSATHMCAEGIPCFHPWDVKEVLRCAVSWIKGQPCS